MNRNIILFATVLAASAMVGCSKEVTSSANIRTAGIAALIDVTAESETSATVHVDLRVGGSSSNTFVILESGDKLTAGAGEEKQTMQAQTEGEYEAEFKTAAAGTEFTVLLEREVDDDALGNRGTMPAPFKITGVPEVSPSRANDDATITWDPAQSGSDMKIELDGSCIFHESIEVAGDPGTHTIKKGTLKSTGGDMPKDCDITVKITRTEVGSADSIFDKESWFKLHQVRSSKFTSKP